MRYQVFSESAYSQETGRYETCGIEVSYSGTVLRTVHDVSTDKEKVTALTERFNREQLSPAHLDEAIESFLYDFEV